MSRFFATAFEPGMLVRHPERPDWGVGTVQSVVGPRVTVTFEEVGKVLVNTAIVALQPWDAESPLLQSSPGSPR
jgi:transcription elongation factor GreA-like protein